MRDMSTVPAYLPAFLPMHRCTECDRVFVHDRDGRIACPSCGTPPAALGVPIAATVVR